MSKENKQIGVLVLIFLAAVIRLIFSPHAGELKTSWEFLLGFFIIAVLGFLLKVRVYHYLTYHKFKRDYSDIVSTLIQMIGVLVAYILLRDTVILFK